MLGNSMVQFEGEEGGVSRSEKLFSEMDNKFGHAFRDGWTLESRIKDMDTEGWDIQVCLPTKAVSLPAFIPLDVQGAMCLAYNSWAHDFCSGAPERIKFTATVPGHDIDDMVAEIRRSVSELGAVSIFLPKAIPEKMWHHPDYTKVWETVTDLEVPISVHGSSSASGEPWTNARYNPHAGPFIALGQAIGFPFENMINLGHFMYSGILDKFPNLKLLILEANSGWVPFWLNRLEKYCEGRQSVFFDDHPLNLTPPGVFLAAVRRWRPTPTSRPSSTLWTTLATTTSCSTRTIPTPTLRRRTNPCPTLWSSPFRKKPSGRSSGTTQSRYTGSG